jgi:hypothetical protein
MMETPVAFVAHEPGPGPGIVVNFGILTGREATQAEVDRLARALLLEAERLSIVATRRHEYGEGSETVVHQVAVQVTDVSSRTTERLRAACEVWAIDCAADRRVESLDV